MVVFSLLPLGNGVVAGTSPRVAAQDTLHGQPKTLDRAMLDECLTGIFGARGSVSACGGGKRGDTPLVKIDGDEQQPCQGFGQWVQEG